MGQAGFRALGSVCLAPDKRTGVLLYERHWQVVAVTCKCGVDHVDSRVPKLERGLKMEFRDQTLGFGG